MSIEKQATFYLRNVCDYDASIKCEIKLTDADTNGFAQFSALLRGLYGDWRTFETSTVPSEPTKIGIMTDDLENYHNLTDTLALLYAVAVTGELHIDATAPFLRVEKAVLKTIYKKSATFPLRMLEAHDFSFTYFKREKAAADYKACDCFHAAYEKGGSLIKSMALLAKRLLDMEKNRDLPPQVAFMLADYRFILTDRVNQDPAQKSIVNTLGPMGGLWEALVPIMQHDAGLHAYASRNPYVFPNRTITFRQGKKTICKFGMNVDCLDIRLPLSPEAAKALILKRDGLPESINRNIDAFGCVNCGKCTDQSNIDMIAGVPLCRLPYSNFITEDSRCLRFNITTRQEVAAIADIFKHAL